MKPIRCKIVDVEGLVIDPNYPDVVALTPDISMSHIGKFGWAKYLSDFDVEITLDDGNILFGYECWWVPVNEGLPIEK